MAYISNFLTHWAGRTKPDDEERYQLVAEVILTNKELLYSRCEIPFGSKYGGIKPGGFFCEMVSFTDIPLAEVEEHSYNYSKFGICFFKSYMVNSCVVPVWYSLNPLVYEAYSYLYQSISGVKSLIDGKCISSGQHADDIFHFDKFMSKLHVLVRYFQDYNEREFNHDERSLEPRPEMRDYFEQSKNYYYEREWRSVYRSGDKYVWNVERDGRQYFRFSERAVQYVIVPRSFAMRMKTRIRNIFSSDHLPQVISYEDLKYM